MNSRLATTVVRRSLVRSYISRAHPVPTPQFTIVDAVEKVLEGIEERKEKRAKKWERNLEAKAKKGIKIEGPYRNQDETVELALALNLDPRKPGQALRGSVALPHGTGKVVKCAVFTNDKEVQKAALEAGAVHVGGESLVDRIVSGEVPLNFDRSIASQDIMGYISSKIARTLGPRGLMPNTKTGTQVKTPDLLLGVLQSQMAGQLQYRTDKEGILHMGVGKGSFGSEKLLDNIRVVMEEVYSVKPELYGKGKKPSKNAVYLLGAHVAATQGKGVKIEIKTVDPTGKTFMSS